MSTPKQPGKDEKSPQRQGQTDGPDAESASSRPDAPKGRPPLPPLPPRQGPEADAPRPTDASGQQSVRGTQVPPWQRGPNARGTQQGAGTQGAGAQAPPSQQREPQTNLKRPEGPKSGPSAAQQAPKQAPAQSPSAQGPADRKPAAPQNPSAQNPSAQNPAAATPPAGQKPAGPQAPAGAQAPPAKQSPAAKQAPAGKPGQAPTGGMQRPAPPQGGTAPKSTPPRPAPPRKGAQAPSAPSAGGQKPAQQREAAKAKAAGIDGPTRHIDRKSLPKDMPDLSEAKHPLPAATASSTGQQPKVVATATPQRVAEGDPLRASVQIRKIDPWSMLKISSLISVSLFFVWMVAVGLLYLVLDGMGVWDRLNSAFTDIVSASGSAEGLVTAGQVFGYAAVIGLVNMVLLTALATIGSFIYNTCSDLVGGLEVTLADRD